MVAVVKVAPEVEAGAAVVKVLEIEVAGAVLHVRYNLVVTVMEMILELELEGPVEMCFVGEVKPVVAVLTVVLQ